MTSKPKQTTLSHASFKHLRTLPLSLYLSHTQNHTTLSLSISSQWLPHRRQRLITHLLSLSLTFITDTISFFHSFPGCYSHPFVRLWHRPQQGESNCLLFWRATAAPTPMTTTTTTSTTEPLYAQGKRTRSIPCAGFIVSEWSSPQFCSHDFCRYLALKCRRLGTGDMPLNRSNKIPGANVINKY